MRILIISDIHGNFTALEEVLNSAKNYDSVWCLGDIVGYGPDPNECILRVQELPNLTCLIGNHDAAAINQIDLEAFNIEARLALNWTKSMLTEKSASFLRNLPEKKEIDDVTLAHGSPRYPIWEYIMDNRTALDNFAHFSTPFCFIGHTHIPAIYYLNQDNLKMHAEKPEKNCLIDLKARTIINPGSVGQPRDNDPRAAYAIFDTQVKTWECFRIPYNFTSVQSRMRKANLPDRHINRLKFGW